MMPPKPEAASWVSSVTVTCTLAGLRARCSATTASAKAVGVRSPAGVLTQSRASAVARLTTWATCSACWASLVRAVSVSTTTSLGPWFAVLVR